MPPGALVEPSLGVGGGLSHPSPLGAVGDAPGVASLSPSELVLDEDLATFIADGVGSVTVEPDTYESMASGTLSWRVLDPDTGRVLAPGEYDLVVPGYVLGPDGALEWRPTGLHPDEPYAHLGQAPPLESLGGPVLEDDYAHLPEESIYEVVDGGLAPDPGTLPWRPDAGVAPALPPRPSHSGAEAGPQGFVGAYAELHRRYTQRRLSLDWRAIIACREARETLDADVLELFVRFGGNAEDLDEAVSGTRVEAMHEVLLRMAQASPDGDGALVLEDLAGALLRLDVAADDLLARLDADSKLWSFGLPGSQRVPIDAQINTVSLDAWFADREAAALEKLALAQLAVAGGDSGVDALADLNRASWELDYYTQLRSTLSYGFSPLAESGEQIAFLRLSEGADSAHLHTFLDLQDALISVLSDPAYHYGAPGAGVVDGGQDLVLHAGVVSDLRPLQDLDVGFADPAPRDAAFDRSFLDPGSEILDRVAVHEPAVGVPASPDVSSAPWMSDSGAADAVLPWSHDPGGAPSFWDPGTASAGVPVPDADDVGPWLDRPWLDADAVSEGGSYLTPEISSDVGDDVAWLADLDDVQRVDPPPSGGPTFGYGGVAPGDAPPWVADDLAVERGLAQRRLPEGFEASGFVARWEDVAARVRRGPDGQGARGDALSGLISDVALMIESGEDPRLEIAACIEALRDAGEVDAAEALLSMGDEFGVVLTERYGYRASPEWIDAATAAVDARAGGDAFTMNEADDALWALYLVSDPDPLDRRVSIMWPTSAGEGLLTTPVVLGGELPKLVPLKYTAIYASGGADSPLGTLEGAYDGAAEPPGDDIATSFARWSIGAPDVGGALIGAPARVDQAALNGADRSGRRVARAFLAGVADGAQRGSPSGGARSIGDLRAACPSAGSLRGARLRCAWALASGEALGEARAAPATRPARTVPTQHSLALSTLFEALRTMATEAQARPVSRIEHGDDVRLAQRLGVMLALARDVA